jgi:succinate dehydrogenase / fumarate reductase iron-sulfur subunit
MSAPAVETTDGAAPPVPEGAVMVTLKIARFNPEDPDAARLAELPGALPSDRSAAQPAALREVVSRR